MKRGFSLVELSIVLVILGLLVGGILAGRSLIRASELRSVSSDFTRYGTAINAFRDKYFAYPGDFSKAESVWGTASGGCPNGARSGTQTCNGDGDAEVEATHEALTFWQHLANAGIIEGSYTGYGTTTAGTNVPRARISGAYVSFPLDSNGNGMLSDDVAAVRYTLTYGKDGEESGGNACIGCGGVLKNEEAWNVDTKMDDGVADQGRFRGELYDASLNGVVDNCTTYTLSNTTAYCIVSYQYFR